MADAAPLKAIELLQQLGFSSYEAKAYVGILENQPVGAYELAKRSGVPSSKVYETINKLLRRGTIQFGESDADNPVYVALPPEDLADQLTHQISQRTSALLPLLKQVNRPEPPDFIWPITSVNALIEKSLALIQSAQKSILVSCWPNELEWLFEVLEGAKSRNTDIALVHFGEPGRSIGATYHHPVERTLYAEKGGRGFTLVVDGESVVIANIADDLIDACWSKNRAFVTVAEDYVKHDVYITKVTKHLSTEMTQRYGAEYEQLRNIFDPEG